MKRILTVMTIAILCYITLLGIPFDALRAFRGTHQGDHLRYFMYLQTARHEGVPAALMKYGVDPN